MKDVRKISMAARLSILGVLAVFAADASKSSFAPNPSCEEAYRRLYRNDTVDFRLVFGYKDARPARLVSDRYERGWLVERLSEMGFVRGTGDDDLFVRRLQGPDGKTKTIFLQVVASSAGPDDQVNRKDPFQSWKSKYAEHVFLDGLRHADVVLYNGHSRNGGGPDFFPPRCAGNSHVNYAWYQRNKPGYGRMLAALRGSRSDLKLLGLFSCVSDKHFSRGLLKVNHRMGLLASETLLYFSNSIESTLETLDDLIAMRCQQGFHPAGTHLIGFFKAL